MISIPLNSRLSGQQLKNRNIRAMLRPESFMTWASFSVLEDAIRSYFKLRFGEDVAILAIMNDYIIPDRPVVDVVLFSDGGYCLQQEHLWPKGLRFRLWVLSRYSSQLLQKWTGLPARLVGILPRDQLFPALRKPESFPSPENGLRLVFSGRADGRGKQFGLACALAAALQEETGSGEFLICGPSMILGLVHREIEKHRWIREPRLLGDRGVDWIKKVDRGVLINLSTFVGEDFGVSVAQAQQAGWPMILSDWGGFRDVVGPNVVKLEAGVLRKAEGSEGRRRQDLLFACFRKGYERMRNGESYSMLGAGQIGKVPDIFIHERHFRPRAVSRRRAIL